uniref:Legume lectin domain-containing protein n=1 Tax=Nelumbo nucifera TaxID=4432 RepID=A0A822YMN0_NELNU|nr:TPA_asm: hypothetical protein HUJ06_012721 [Nelumbo nucifera]
MVDLASGVGININLNGVAHIWNDGIPRLTNKTSHFVGHAFYPSPLRFKNSIDGTAFSLSTSFAFAIVPKYLKLGGHGLAFMISLMKELKGELPRTSPTMFSLWNLTQFDQDFEFDINDNHVKININDLKSNASVTVAYYTDTSSKEDLNLKGGKMIRV